VGAFSARVRNASSADRSRAAVFAAAIRLPRRIIGLILGGAGVLIIVVVAMVIRHETHRLSSRAEAAYPGPLD
jgi:hypothetical protein